MAELAYIKLWAEFEKYFGVLGAVEVGRLILGAQEYAFHGTEPQFTGNERILWPVLKESIDKDKAYNEKQQSNGSKGGRPKKSNETQNNPEKPNETQNNPEKHHIENRKQKTENISFVSNDTQDICQAESLATRKRASAFSAKKAIEDYTQDEELRGLLLEWLDNRKKKRAPETKGAIGQNLDKLAEMAAESNLSLQDYMREIVRMGWQAFYPIRSQQTAQRNDGRDFDWLTGQ